jgi:hypothetical protein
MAFLASFCLRRVIWLNHRAVFARVRYCDRSLHLANLFLLLTSALIPFPTAILSAAIHSGNELDAKVPVTLYAAIAGSTCLAWLVVFHVLSIHPYLVEDGVVRTSSRRSVSRLGRRYAVCRSGPGWLAIDTETGHADLSGIAGFLRHHQRGFDGKHGFACSSEEPIAGFCEERSREGAR